MDEKTIQRIKKLQALAERGVGGEKDTAEKMLQKMLERNGIRSLDELQSEEYEYTLFSYNGKHESDMRIDRSTVPEGLYQYEVADDDESQGDPARVKKGIMVNFWGTLISDVPLPLGSDGVLWLDDGDFLYL